MGLLFSTTTYRVAFSSTLIVLQQVLEILRLTGIVRQIGDAPSYFPEQFAGKFRAQNIAKFPNWRDIWVFTFAVNMFSFTLKPI